ncbi:hypothetical protein [Legionella sp. CNM-4043-24]|uniref:hypothetical protein n=1 Tax=Legionella sp. CNM-4043-24 TaxID=3421646 RepID=UPI00403A7D80
MAYSKLHPMALGLTLGAISGFAAFVAGLMAMAVYTGKPAVAMMGEMYVSYNPSFFNSVLGGGIVFVNAYVGAYVTAWIYNILIKRI